jgi:hypothetical protein
LDRTKDLKNDENFFSFYFNIPVTLFISKIQRGSGTVQAQLVQLLTEGTASPNPRWLIRYTSNSKDDEVYEHSFLGKVGLNSDENLSSQSPDHNVIDDDSHAVSHQQQLIEVAMENPRALKKKKSDISNDIELVVNSDSSVGRKGAAKSDKSSRASNKNTALSTSTREVRSRRRGQPLPEKEPHEENYDETARIDERSSQKVAENIALSAQQQQQQQRKRKLTGAAKMSVETKRERESKTAKSSTNTSSLATTTKQQQHQKEEEECVKIKFLTGTLYLYRGKRRRAEFVRRV